MIYSFDALSFQVLTVDLFSHKDGFFEVAARPYAAFSFRLSGKGVFEIGNKKFLTQKGDVLFLPANLPYRVTYAASESIVVHFAQCNYSEAENVTPSYATSIELLFRRLLEAWNGGHSVNHAKSVVYQILEKIEEDKRSELEDSSFARCIQYLDAHFCDPTLDIATVCRAGFISASTLQRSFLTHLGLSPKQYLLKLRMNRALELLSENKLTVKEIAFACGFQDEKYFSRAFKKKYGYPPSEMQQHMFI